MRYLTLTLLALPLLNAATIPVPESGLQDAIEARDSEYDFDFAKRDPGQVRLLIFCFLWSALL